MNPLVSVITGTRDRLPELKRCILQVRAQTYRPLEHVIVSDGPDPMARVLVGMQEDFQGVPIIFQETGRVWSDIFVRSDGAAAFQVAQLLARGDWQMWFADDEEMDPDHILKLMTLIQQTNSDFGYSQARWYTNPSNPRLPCIDNVIGSFPPVEAQLTNCLYSIALLDYGKFETHGGRGTDWAQVEAWIKAGARYCFLEETTFTHRADQVGGHNSNTTRQVLRGHDRVRTAASYGNTRRRLR